MISEDKVNIQLAKLKLANIKIAEVSDNIAVTQLDVPGSNRLNAHGYIDKYYKIFDMNSSRFISKVFTMVNCYRNFIIGTMSIYLSIHNIYDNLYLALKDKPEANLFNNRFLDKENLVTLMTRDISPDDTTSNNYDSDIIVFREIIIDYNGVITGYKFLLVNSEGKMVIFNPKNMYTENDVYIQVDGNVDSKVRHIYTRRGLDKVNIANIDNDLNIDNIAEWTGGIVEIIED